MIKKLGTLRVGADDEMQSCWGGQSVLALGSAEWSALSDDALIYGGLLRFGQFFYTFHSQESLVDGNAFSRVNWQICFERGKILDWLVILQVFKLVPIFA